MSSELSQSTSSQDEGKRSYLSLEDVLSMPDED